MTRFLSALFILVMSSAADAGDAGSYINVIVEYTSMFPGKIQVRDNVCRESRDIECAKADIKLESEACRSQPQPPDCKEARSLLDTSFCIEGLVHEERVSRGAKIDVRLCLSGGGFGNMSVRDVEKGTIWTNYDLLSNGKTVSYP